MKANEFVKKFGWGDAKICLLNCASPQDKWFMYQGMLICNQDFDDLKRLIESHELVESCGGLDKAKKKLSTEQSEPYYNYSQQLVDSLKQAIADVESCQ